MQNKTAGTVTLAALFAHEFAHIKQFEVDCDLKSIIGSTYCRRIELQADYMAGWALYHYLREEFYGSTLTLNAVGNAWRSLAPSDVNKQSTHGGPSQRVDALGAGYEFALRNNDSNIGTGVVMYEGAQYVRKFT
ncbi:MAG: hypothetical protein MRY59_14000 [Aquisalinus sp.]|nr:hypothetical protein [Aquisalinus sp.]